MSMTQETLEIMIGKFLDGEITPSERRLLEAELDGNPQARELFEQLQALNERCDETVASEILGRGKAPEEIFEQGWARQSGQPLRLWMQMRGYGRFAAGVAAGLVIGLLLHFVVPGASGPQGEPAQPKVVARNPTDEGNVTRPPVLQLATDPAGDVIRNVDWYNFTDVQGNKWLVEGLRENMVKPAAYHEGL